jgi:hypothetical protein
VNLHQRQSQVKDKKTKRQKDKKTKRQKDKKTKRQKDKKTQNKDKVIQNDPITQSERCDSMALINGSRAAMESLMHIR